jgi:hypothetical protein
MNVKAMVPDRKGTLTHYVAAAFPLSKHSRFLSRCSYLFGIIHIFIGSAGDYLGSYCVHSKERLSRPTTDKIADPIRVANQGLEKGVPTILIQIIGRL